MTWRITGSSERSRHLEELASLRPYFSEIGRYSVLSKEEECRLFKEYQDSGRRSPALFKQIAEANLRFAAMIALKYAGKGIPVPDLIQEGNTGLIKAIQHYDYRRNVRFISYAVWWIRQGINEALQEQTRLIHIPANRIVEANRAKRESDNYFKYHGKEIPEKELQKLGICPEKIIHDFDIISLDQELSGRSDEDSDNKTYHDMVHENGDFTDKVAYLRLREALGKAFESYPAIFSNEKTSQELERDVQILKMRFGINGYPPMTLNEIGEMFNLSRERIRQIEKKAKARLKEAIAGLARSEKSRQRKELSDFLHQTS